jgi:hypothetical protein
MTELGFLITFPFYPHERKTSGDYPEFAMGVSRGKRHLPPFTFQQADVSLIEFQALPGPEARALRAKTMRQHSFSGLGGQLKCGMPIAECGMGKKT